MRQMASSSAYGNRLSPMRHWIAGLAFLVFPTVAWADHFEEVVTLQCDTADGELTVLHQGAYNDAGSALTAHLSHDQWNVRALYNASGTPRTVSRSCSLHGLTYRIVITGLTWNRDHSDMSAHVRISVRDRVLFDGDLDPSPFDSTSSRQFVATIVVKSGSSNPQITTLSQREFR